MMDEDGIKGPLTQDQQASLAAKHERAALSSEQLVGHARLSADAEQETWLVFHATLAQWHRERAAHYRKRSSR